MNDLVDQMKVCLASVFAFYLKTHNFHWNVEGPNFPQYHSFLDGLYNDVWESVDKFGEEIRTLGSYAPASLSRYQTLSVIDDQLNIPTAIKMIKELEMDNKRLIGELMKANKLAEKHDCVGLANFLQDRIDVHYKHDWMLRSIGKA
jgi:starvation-inducible DNA-binding protein